MNWLNELEGVWGEARTKAAAMPKMITIPDGQHKAVISGAEVDPERPYVRFYLKFPDFGNIPRTKVIFVTGQLEYVIRELASIGLDILSPKDLPSAAAASVGKVVQVTVKTKPGKKYSDIYFNKDLGERVNFDNDIIADSDNPASW